MGSIANGHDGNVQTGEKIQIPARAEYDGDNTPIIKGSIIALEQANDSAELETAFDTMIRTDG